MTVRGTCESWDDDEGWGVVVSPDVPGRGFAHFSDIRDMDGYRNLRPGQPVEFDLGRPGQDGCDYSVAWVRCLD
jgi:CspA family cold shock protein